MTFVHPLLLGGLLLVGVPVLIHLMMAQKPKRLAFPAFRFLVQKHRTNQRRLRLRHWILLALRMLLIALLCLALARPKIFNERLNLGTNQPVAAVLVIDTSMSMQYTEGEQTRLDDAKRRARELIDDLPEQSRIAVFDTAESGSGVWIDQVGAARDRIDGMDLKAANGPITDVLASAYRLLHSLDDEPDQTGEAMPRFLYVFSDRTEAAWDASRVPQLVELRDRSKTKVLAAFVDLGVATPIDLAITELKLPRQLIPANGRFIVHVNIRATNKDYDTAVDCRIDGEKTAQRQAIQRKAGHNDWITFERRGLSQGLHQAEISLVTSDNLPYNNGRFVTFEVTGARRVLTICDEASDADIWKLVLRLGDPPYACDVKTTREANELTPAELGRYKAVCLLSVAAPDRGLWEKLAKYVEGGGGLAVIPGGAALNRPSYNETDEAQKLLPGKLGEIVQLAPDKGVAWDEQRHQAPVKEWFAEWKRFVDEKGRRIAFTVIAPTAFRYWDVQPSTDAFLLATYADDKKRPALLERKFDRSKVRGKVLLFTTAMDRQLTDEWNEYLNDGGVFYAALANRAVGYLSGDALEANLNHLSRPGQPVRVPLPPEGRFATYVLDGPGLVGQAGVVSRLENQNDLSLPQAVKAGNYVLIGSDAKSDAKWQTGFSLNVPPEECNLKQVPAEQIETLFGAGSVLPIGHNINFRDALQGHWSQPVELLPWLMILLLVALAVENLLANKFYRKVAQGTETEAKMEN